MRLRVASGTVLSAAALLCVALCACNSPAPEPAPPAPPTSQGDNGATAPAPDPGAGSSADPQPAPTAPPSVADRLSEAEQHLAADRAAEAQAICDELQAKAAEFTPAERDRLAALVTGLSQRERMAADEQRTAALAAAAELLAAGDLEGTMARLQEVTVAAPTADQLQQVNDLEAEVERRRRVRRELQGAIEMLASESRDEVRAAQSRLRDDVDDAIPLLVAACQSADPRLVANALDTLRRLDDGERATAAMVDVLKRTDQPSAWQPAIEALASFNAPGAGAPLLAALEDSQDAAQQAAVLTALAQVSDPPAELLAALLPRLQVGDPNLPLALAAARHAVETHRQSDLAALRGLPTNLTAPQRAQLAGLGAQLQAIVAADPASEAAQQAQALAVTLRLSQGQPLAGATVLRASSDTPEAPAAALLDGVWNQNDLLHQWKHVGAVSPQAVPSVTFDLQTVRTVTAIRIWNYNELSAGHRGWKEVDLFVGEQPALLEPVVQTVLPPAPAVANAADFGVAVPVPLVRGRYVKLQARSVWRDDGASGLTEVQILGF